MPRRRPVRVTVAVVLIAAQFAYGTWLAGAPYFYTVVLLGNTTVLRLIGPAFLVRFIIQVTVLVAIFKGKNWGRVLAVVLFVLTLLLVAVGLPRVSTLSMTLAVVILVQLAALIVGIGLLYTGSAREWFRKSEPLVLDRVAAR